MPERCEVCGCIPADTLRTTEVARALNTSASFVSELCRKGEIKATKVRPNRWAIEHYGPGGFDEYFGKHKDSILPAQDDALLGYYEATEDPETADSAVITALRHGWSITWSRLCGTGLRRREMKARGPRQLVSIVKVAADDIQANREERESTK